MNTLAQPLKAAGVKTPSLYKRVHNYLADHPETRSSRIAQELKIEKSLASATLAQMENRKMVKSIIIPTKDAHGAMRRVKYYSTLLREYELLPMPANFKPKYRKGENRNAKVAKSGEIMTATPAPVVAPVAAPEPTPAPVQMVIDYADRPDVGVDMDAVHFTSRPIADKFPFDVESLTIREARVLWNQLNELFGFNKG